MPGAYPTYATSLNLQLAPDVAGTAGSYVTIPTIGTNVTLGSTVHDTGLAVGGKFWYRFAALNDAGTTPGPGASITLPPAAPAALVVTPMTDVDVDIAIPGLAGGATSYNLRRAPDASGSPGTPATIATNVAQNSVYHDNALVDDTNYWWALVAVNGGGSVVGPYVQATTKRDATPEVFFSTGRLMLFANADTPEGFAVPEDGIEVATIQDASLDVTFQEKKLYGPAWVSAYPVAVAFYNGAVSIKATSATFNADVIRLLASATQSGSSTLTDSVTRVAILPAFKLVFVSQDLNGNQMRHTFMKVYAPGLVLPIKQDNFTLPQITFSAIPDDDGDVMTIEFTTGAFAS